MTDGLALIGAAFPRTGTMSVKNALETLGIGRCYHMHEVFQNPQHISIWNDTCNGQMPNWRKLFAGYTVTLDAPACLYWRELTIEFPDAKVILLQRDPGTWYESMYSTIYQVIMNTRGEVDPALRMIRHLFFDKYMGKRFEDRDFAVARYRQYCEDVIAGIPQDQLLVYEVSEGWHPLCSFLGYEVPATPFPNKNTRGEFRTRSKLS
jgi:hypothetical protein